MVPSIKLAVISKTGEEASCLGKSTVFVHLLYTLVENSHISYLLAPINSVKSILFLTCVRF